MGCYQEGLAKDAVAGKDVNAHIFEFVANVLSGRIRTDKSSEDTRPTSSFRNQAKFQKEAARSKSSFA